MVTKKDKFLAAAQKLLEKGSLDKALAEFLKAVQEDPKDTRTWLRIAEIHVKRGDNEKATEVYLRTAGLYVEQGFFQRAVAVYKNIVKLSPNYVEAYLKLAEIYKQLGLLSDAIQQLQLAAGVFQRTGRVKESMDAMRQIVEINPDQPVPRIKLAEAAAQAGLVAEAITEFSRAGELLRNQGRMDEYLRVAERLLALQPDDITLAKSVAKQYIDRNNSRFALAKLQACFKLDPRDTETLDLLARAFEQLGQTAKTVSVLKELAKVYSDSGRNNEKIVVYKRIAVLDPTDVEARDVLATRASYVPPPPKPAAPVVEPPRRPRQAAITFSEMAVPQFLRDMPDGPSTEGPSTATSTAERLAIASGLLLEPSEDEATAQVQRIIAESDVFVKYGLVDRAVDHLRKVFELVPTHSGAHERLAAVLLQLGRNAEAVAQLEVLAEHVVQAQPEAAAEYARRALAIDAKSRRARKVLEMVGAAAEESGEVEELEEISSALIEMATPEPEVLTPGPRPQPVEHLGSADLEEDVDLSSEDETANFATHDETSEESTALTPSPYVEPATNPNLEPYVDEQAAREFENAGQTAGDDGTYAAMFADLEQVDFFLDQGLAEDALTQLEDIRARYPASPLIDDRVKRLEAMYAAQAHGAVPVSGAVAGGSHSTSYSSGIAPKAMVSAGGEMDLESHRDLGIGYKDMGLFDAAINEFSMLTSSPALEVFALTMIGECHEAKGALADAVAFYKKALNRPTISDPEATQLYYQLGSIFQSMNEVDEALYFFDKVLRRDTGFRDVSRRVAELRGNKHGPGGGTVDSAGDMPALDAFFTSKNRR